MMADGDDDVLADMDAPVAEPFAAAGILLSGRHSVSESPESLDVQSRHSNGPASTERRFCGVGSNILSAPSARKRR
jgi:hypothetical protein